MANRPHLPHEQPSETLLSRPMQGDGPPVRAAEPEPRASLLDRFKNTRRAPFLRLVLYYVVLLAVASLLVYFVPAVRDALLPPTSLPTSKSAFLKAEFDGAPGGTLDVGHLLSRGLVTFLTIAAALALVVPVVRVYMFTKRFRYDPALVRSVIILPIVVCGIVLVVKNSIALAFSLAGIVAAVRFRNTLKDPRDAVYIFLSLGIGLSSGVQALDVALVMSVFFNFVVLLMWRYNIGSIYGGQYGRTGILSVGDSALVLAREPQQQRDIRRRMLDDDHGIRTDGILLVHTPNSELARMTVTEALGDMARDWTLADIVPREDGLSTLYYLVRLKEDASAPDLLGALDERWAEQVSAAEYVPFRTRRKGKKKRR
jgi:hypothetical protein